MLLLEWIVPLLIGAVGLTFLARKLGAPYPAFLALGGMGIALLPVGPNFALEPDLALALFVAPVLLDTAYDASIRDLRDNWLPIGCLVIAAVLLTTMVVAIVARMMLPDLPWAAAVALGAIVAPPDATASAAILRQVRLPFRIAVILEGESLLNDASALFIFRLALGTVAVGAFHGGFLATSFMLVLPLSLAAGYGLAQITMRLIDRIDDPPSSIILQFALTFGVWMLAEALQLSAVLTIIAYAVTVSQSRPRRFGARLRIPAFAVWETATFMLNVIAFVLIGLQLRPILEGMQTDRLITSFGFAFAILAVCIATRFAWVVGYQMLQHLRRRSIRKPSTPAEKPDLKSAIVVSWCGMRGIVTLAAAFALPDGGNGEAAFPHRDLMLLTAFIVVLGTLVLQGLTLRPLLRWADLSDDDPVGRETGRARASVFRAALAELGDERGSAVDALRNEYAFILSEAEAHPDGFAPAKTEQDELRLRTIGAARSRLHDLRLSREIGNEAFNRIEAELDQAEMHASAV
jgi:Na+/H+ antiporter